MSTFLDIKCAVMRTCQVASQLVYVVVLYYCTCPLQCECSGLAVCLLHYQSPISYVCCCLHCVLYIVIKGNVYFYNLWSTYRCCLKTCFCWYCLLLLLKILVLAQSGKLLIEFFYQCICSLFTVETSECMRLITSANVM